MPDKKSARVNNDFFTMSYDPKTIEAKWYSAWLEANAFAGKYNEDREPFCIVIPPPNVTGTLHMGHVLNNTLQDIFIRRARLEGKAVLWVPGTDHAGIATQARVERQVLAEGSSRADLGRENFVKRIWQWREEHGGLILKQLKKLGASCDWDRSVFTLDKGYSHGVQTAFVELYKRGHIYRGKRMVNWCPVSQTALSDEEVIPTPQKSILYQIRYALVDRPGEYLRIATTRPETLMGDVAVAVNPEDERYQHLIGQYVWRPFPKAKLPIIADAHVDPKFGTGALKITPAHDPADFEIGQRHDLPFIDIFHSDGTLNANAGAPFTGMDRFAARKAVAKKLKEENLLLEEKPYDNIIGFSERASVPIEPRLSEQWFLKYPKVEEAKEVVRQGLIRFHPERWAKTYLHWLDGIRDWCISRQLWWGHRIPVWYRKGEDKTQPENWHVSVDGPDDPENWEQDADVLDTWASSFLWPFAVFGWPNPNEQQQRDLNFFYPTSVLCTGFDIIFFWVARMIMAGLEFMGPPKEHLGNDDLRARIPFREVYITGLIRDAQNRKMSKSLGNSPDPLDLIERFGADGLRFGIINIAPTGQDILFSEERIAVGRHFCNKLWNACRFRQISDELKDNSSVEVILERIDAVQMDAYDHWMLSRLIVIHEALEMDFKKFEMHPVTHQLHNFFWGDFCDWYVEASKRKLKADPVQRNNCLAIQDIVLRQSLLLLHPIIPHISEELWSQMGYGKPNTFIQAVCLESAEKLNQKLSAFHLSPSVSKVEAVESIKGFISQARALKADYNLAARKELVFFLKVKDSQKKIFEEQRLVIEHLIGAKSIHCATIIPETSVTRVTPLGELALDLKEAIDIEAEKERLTKELAKLDKAVLAGEKKLNNPKFLRNAPPPIVEGAKKQLAETLAQREAIQKIAALLKKYE